MKHLLPLLLLIPLVFFSSPVSADFFEEQIVGADTETDMIRNIRLDNVSLKDTKEMTRYQNTAYFVTSIKNEAIKRFDDGTISVYRRYDIVTALDSFVYDMNRYFAYSKMYENNRKPEYRESAKSYLGDAKWAYARLKSALKNSAY